MLTAIILFAIAAAGGLTLAALRLREKPLPLPIALLHGAIAAAGLVAIIVVVAGEHGTMLADVSLAMFILTALGGFTLFAFHLMKKPLPIPLIVIHALAAISGLSLLVAAYLGVG